MNTVPSSVTDSQGNLFTPVGNQLASPGGTRSRVYYAKNIKGGADTVTVNSVWDFRLDRTVSHGILRYNQTNPIDAQAGASGTAGAVSSGNATTTVAGDVIYGFCMGDWNCTAGSGFAARSNFNGNLIEDKLAGNAGSYAATGTANKGWTIQSGGAETSFVWGRSSASNHQRDDSKRNRRNCLLLSDHRH